MRRSLFMAINRPLVFVDLDDTLFQTARKMAEGPRCTATLDAFGQPNGFMNATQQGFVEWLLATTDVVPVTARSVEAYQRVQLPFAHGAICAHGGVILSAQGVPDGDWHARMCHELAPEQARLHRLSEQTLALGAELGFSLRSWVVEEQGLATYVVTKHNYETDHALLVVCAEARARGLLNGLNVHGNGNNLAFLPQALQKREAVREWIRRDQALNGKRPLLGFGDSLSDLGFMTECDWWGTPKHGQLASHVRASVDHA